MRGLGTLINVAFIIIGSSIGLIAKKGLSERIKNTVICAVGLSTCFIGIGGVLSKMLYLNSDGSFSTKDTMFMVISLVIGAFFGELLNIEKYLENFGEFCKRKIKVKNGAETFVDGFVSASLLYCVGAMAIMGSLEDGLNGNISTLFAKSILDGTMSVFLAASFGIGVVLSVLPVFVYQGAITLLSGFISPYLSETLINQMTLVGSVLIFAIGLNMLAVTKLKIKTGNLLPAIFVPIVYHLILKLFS